MQGDKKYMEQLANMPVWAQMLSMGSFMFINGLIGGGHPFVNLVIFSLFGLINKKLGILFFILAIIAGFGELIGRVAMNIAGEWASGMGSRDVASGIDAWIMYTYGLINGLLCAIAFYWVWKTVGKFWPDLGTWSLYLGIVMYVLGLSCAVFVLPLGGVSFITTLIGIVMLVVALRTPFSLIISGLSICVIIGGLVIFSLKNPRAAQKIFPIKTVENIVKDIFG